MLVLSVRKRSDGIKGSRPRSQALELPSFECLNLLCAGAEPSFTRICVTGISGAAWGPYVSLR